VFNIGPFELLVLAAVGLLVFGPDKLPQLSRDAARMIRTLRDMAQGARAQLNDELGPEFANFDLNSLNPKTALRNAILGDDDDLRAMNPKDIISRAIRGEDPAAGTGRAESQNGTGGAVNMSKQPPAGSTGSTPYDADAT
jgi:sec-independent protein translocase protein TatB